MGPSTRRAQEHEWTGLDQASLPEDTNILKSKIHRFNGEFVQLQYFSESSDRDGVVVGRLNPDGMCWVEIALAAVCW